MTSSHPPHFAIGIDLGTTTTSLSYIRSDRHDIETFAIMQMFGKDGSFIKQPLLPSFAYVPTKADLKKDTLKLPTQTAVPKLICGELAKNLLHLEPDQVIHSAKSWLCHKAIDREMPSLPFHSNSVTGDDRLSPVTVLASYLNHVLDLFTKEHPEIDLKEQHITITVPASFDEVAQQLTLKAALNCGFLMPHVRLLEEPHAAFLCWLAQHKEPLPHRYILVVDIGGGTTDFSLFHHDPSAPEAPIRRIAVSDHILLGGDNIDGCIAEVLTEAFFKASGEKQLSLKQYVAIRSHSRQLKELIFNDPSWLEHDPTFAQKIAHISIQKEGFRLFGNTISLQIPYRDIGERVLQQFFPLVAKTSHDLEVVQQVAESGLPYAKDQRFTAHLSHFCSHTKHPIDAVLLTGGTLIPPVFQQKILDTLKAHQSNTVTVLQHQDMELAVSKGAAWHSYYTKNLKHPISSGYPRSLYMEIAATPETKASETLLCIVPKGQAPETPLRIDLHGLQITADEMVRFQTFTALHRDDDKPGAIVAKTSDMQPLPPLKGIFPLTEIAPKKGPTTQIPVYLEANLKDSGLLHLEIVAKDHPKSRMTLSFSTVAHTPSEEVSPMPLTEERTELQAVMERVYSLIDTLYGPAQKQAHDIKANSLLRQIEQITGKEREQLSFHFLRNLWPKLYQGMTKRGRSIPHEISFYQLTGYCLRPGIGGLKDAHYISQLWRLFKLHMVHPDHKQVQEQWAIMWRRVAAGLAKDQQEILVQSYIKDCLRHKASPEALMMVCSMERINTSTKVRLGEVLCEGSTKSPELYLWCLTRLMLRRPLYAGLETVVHPTTVAKWLEALLPLPLTKRLAYALAEGGRRVDDPMIDIPDGLRAKISQKLQSGSAYDEEVNTLTSNTSRSLSKSQYLVGESLPIGLMLKFHNP